MADDVREVGVETAAEECSAVVERIEEAVVVDRSVLSAILAAVVARGHVLLEDVPGTGKTVTARVLAESLGLEFQRIQFTPDLLPSDVTGSNVYNEHDRTFEFAEGPIFANVVLADEINRAPPKTQAALLEAMEERQVSVDGTTHELPTPFIVIATQNPVEQEGTFRLPEAQRDRFLVKTSIGYPDVEGEMGLLEKRANRRTIAPSVEPAIDRATVLGLQALAEGVAVEDKVRRYIIELARYTRSDARTEIGVSPRGVQRVFEATRAAAVIAGRDYVTPDDVKRIAVVAMAHRLVLTTEATVEGVRAADVVFDALEDVYVPAVSPDAPEGAAGMDPAPAREQGRPQNGGQPTQANAPRGQQAGHPEGSRPSQGDQRGNDRTGDRRQRDQPQQGQPPGDQRSRGPDAQGGPGKGRPPGDRGANPDGGRRSDRPETDGAPERGRRGERPERERDEGA
jgi:MoxR-like ATPase